VAYSIPVQTVALFSINHHVAKCVVIMEALVEAGHRVVVFGDQSIRLPAMTSGATFVDIKAGGEIEAIDDDSVPRPVRVVTFAGEQAHTMIEAVKPHHPNVVVLDSFSVVGRVVAEALGLPYVIVHSGHNWTWRAIPQFVQRPDVQISERCANAIAVLRNEYGIADASPWLFLPRASPFLNLYGEPPQYITPESRRALEPVRFFGTVPADLAERARLRPAEEPVFSPKADRRIYASFGRVWTGGGDRLIPWVTAIVEAVERSPGLSLIIGLGGHRYTEGPLAQRDNDRVRVVEDADQARMLAEADVFITHHGAKSTHEAILLETPMVSMPVGSDQPSLARRCQELGLAVPLAAAPPGTPTAADVLAALEQVERKQAVMMRALSKARAWERAVIEGRQAIVNEIAQLGAG
jgi:UDP:flavonoid glycosyltransferase YjiC (YdhE family)